jgi:hypothetical protein
MPAAKSSSVFIPSSFASRSRNACNRCDVVVDEVEVEDVLVTSTATDVDGRVLETKFFVDNGDGDNNGNEKADDNDPCWTFNDGKADPIWTRLPILEAIVNIAVCC